MPLLRSKPYARAYLAARYSLVFAQVSVASALPLARAVIPPPDGGYPNQNTAEGDDALFSLTAGIGNTAVGNSALYSITDGVDNTAVGSGALNANTASYNTAIGMFSML